MKEHIITTDSRPFTDETHSIIYIFSSSSNYDLSSAKVYVDWYQLYNLVSIDPCIIYDTTKI